MTPKDILIVADSAHQEGAFAAAEALAKRYSAHVSCLQRVEIPDPSADLIVMGGYGHARLILGGVTRALNANCRLPIVLSH